MPTDRAERAAIFGKSSSLGRLFRAQCTRQGGRNLRDGPSVESASPLLARSRLMAGSAHRSTANRPTAWPATIRLPCGIVCSYIRARQTRSLSTRPGSFMHRPRPMRSIPPASSVWQYSRGRALAPDRSCRLRRRSCRRPNSFCRWSLDSLGLCGKCGESAGFSPRSILFF